jgi:hypothetical protein
MRNGPANLKRRLAEFAMSRRATEQPLGKFVTDVSTSDSNFAGRAPCDGTIPCISTSKRRGDVARTAH